MPVVAPAAAAASAAVTGGTLFQYNRKNFMYDRTMRQETEYQIMEMQINKQDMFREDIEDIVELTAVKMDTYTIVTVIQLGFCIIALCEGRLGHGTPPWLVCMHTLTLVTAFSYFLLSVWLAMHATIAANAYKVRLRTQIVRLPIPSWAQLEGARTYASTFEKTEGRQMFRVPFLCGKQDNVAKGSCLPSLRPKDSSRRDSAAAAPQRRSQSTEVTEETPQDRDQCKADYKNMPTTDPWGLERPGADIYELDGALQTDPRKLQHIQLVREAMQYWAASDAFARVTMSIGTQLFAVGLAYYVIGYVLIINHAIVGAWLAVMLFLAVAWAVLRIDMSLTRSEYILSLFLFLSSPICGLLCGTFWAMDRYAFAIQIMIPIAYVAHVLWLGFLLHICKVTEQKNGVMLPTGYRAVLYIDVFGWIKSNVAGTSTARGPSSPEQLPEPEKLSGNGPAVQGVRYEDRRPVPMRVEQLPGANRPPDAAQGMGANLMKGIEGSFAPSTFVPPHIDAAHETDEEHGTEGRRPWETFRAITAAFGLLWFISGVVVTMELFGLTPLPVAPQLAQDKVGFPVTALLSLDRHPEWLPAGHQISTSWPHGNVKPIGIACDGARKTMVVSSRFGLYTADLSDRNRIQFQTAPTCEAVDGEALQDVSLRCGSSTSSDLACQAVVLHQNGRRLTTCSLGKVSEKHEASSIANITGHWLTGNSKDGQVQIQSLSLSPHCPGRGYECTFVGTGDHRIIELQTARARDGAHSLFPKRLFGTKSTTFSSVPAGAMAVLQSRYLGLLQRDGRRLQALDLQSGAIAGLWRLPDHPEDKTWIPQGKAWTALCATGDDIYLLSKGLSPQLWRFPVPQALRRTERPAEAGHEAMVQGAAQVAAQ